YGMLHRVLLPLDRVAELDQRIARRRAAGDLDDQVHAAVAQEDRHVGIGSMALGRQLRGQRQVAGQADQARLPPEMMLWLHREALHREALRRRAGAEPAGLPGLPPPRGGEPVSASAVVARGAKRLSFTLHAVDPDALGEGQWLIVMREADDAALMDGLMHGFKLTAREAE